MDVVSTAGFVSDFTKRTLQQFGWEPGDPVPADFGALIAEINERTPRTKAAGLIIDISAMAETDIAAVKQALADAKVAVVQAVHKAQVNQATAGLPESARQLYGQILDNENAPQIIDDRQTVAEAPAPPPEPPAPQQQQPQPVNDPVQLPPPEQSAPVTAVTCPRCLWDMRRDYDVEITDFDKEAFIAITLAGERFRKTYSLLNGKYSVTFRSLLAQENTIIHHQLLLDQKDGDFLSDTEWFLRMFEYRMACSIATIEITGQIPRHVPELAEVGQMALPNKTDDVKNPPLVRLREYVLNDQLKSELTRRLVGAELRQFQRLYEALEAMAFEPSFW